MKKIFFSLFLISSCTYLFAQNGRRHDDTPKPVQEAFNKEHPNAGNAHWAQTKGHWHATYNNNNRKVDDYYDNKGSRLYTRTAWDRKSLPGDYDKKIRSRYHTTNYRVTKIERPNNPSLFELILNIGGKNKTVYTDENGVEVKFKL